MNDLRRLALDAALEIHRARDCTLSASRGEDIGVDRVLSDAAKIEAYLEKGRGDQITPAQAFHNAYMGIQRASPASAGQFAGARLGTSS